MKSLSQMSQDELLVHEAMKVFGRHLRKAKRIADEYMKAEQTLFDDLDLMCIDAESTPSNAENAENLKEAICCYLLYGEYGFSNVMREVHEAYMKGGEQ